jgi:hypothetical protein
VQRKDLLRFMLIANGNNSGALYSSDGITWTASTENPAFSGVANVYANPLAG